jgi:putative endonuclease
MAPSRPGRGSPDAADAAERARRQAAFRFGLSAESRAAALLIAKGYRIAARRFRSPHGEIDIVARRGRALVFVEVKARERPGDAAWSLTARQQARILAGAKAWLAAHPDDVSCYIRFDVILVAPRSIPEHIANAFDASER